MNLSIVIPVYQAEHMLEELLRQIHAAIKPLKITYEVILVDDGSTDNSWTKICSLKKTDPHIRGIQLSRNFGQHAAIRAGCRLSAGDYVTVMDCDLQDNPKDIPALWKGVVCDGHDIVFISRRNYGGWYRKMQSKMFFLLFNLLCHTNLSDKTGNYCIATRRVMQEYNNYTERDISHTLILLNLGFSIHYLESDRGTRFEGKSTYSYKKLLKLAVQYIVSYSSIPLWWSLFVGFVFSSGAFILGGLIIVRYFVFSLTTPGWTSLMAVVLMCFSILFAFVGIQGIYMSQILEETRSRPIYIVQATTDE